MKKSIVGILFAGAFAMAANASYMFVDNNPADVYLNALNRSYDGQFNLTDYGFNPATMDVISAQAEFTLWDLLGRESVVIRIEGEDFAGSSSFAGTITLGGEVVGDLLANLNDDGILGYRVQSNTALGEFWLTNARLEAQAVDAQVPEAATTAVLLGLGIAALGAVRKRIA